MTSIADTTLERRQSYGNSTRLPALPPAAAFTVKRVRNSVELSQQHQIRFLALLLGFLILFDTQVAIFEALVRNFTDSMNAISPRFRRITAGDPRRFYFPFMIFLLVVIAIIIRLAVPTRLISITANMSNFGALFFPFVLMNLNSKLPGPAKPPGYTYVLLFLNFLFFGFFFINFIADTFFGGPLVVF